MKLWIARDLDGTLGLFSGNKPKPILGEWMPDDSYLCMDDHLFPEITFENSPQQVELKLI